MPIADEPFNAFSCCEGLVSVQIPVSWQGYDEGEWLWSCYDDDNDTGTLWISVMAFQRPYPSSDGDDPENPSVADVRAAFRAQFAPDGSDPVADDGPVVKYEKDFAEEGEDLRGHWTHGLVPAGRGLLVISFHLVLSVEQLATPEYQALRSRMDAEIDRALNAASGSNG